MPAAPADRQDDCSEADSDEERVLNGEDFLVSAPVMPSATPKEETSKDNQANRQALLDSFKKLSSKINLASEKKSQKTVRKEQGFQRAQARAAQIAAAIESGEISLPPLEKDAYYTILDSGSTICAADHTKVFTGAELQSPEPNGERYYTATGQPFGNKGSFTVPFTSENGHHKQTTFLNAPVAMPITSLHE